MKPRCLVVAYLALVCSAPVGYAQPTKVLSWGDQGNGTFVNPVIKADYSDPDVIRHGDDFYLIASDFHFVGIQVLHSKDLVNWRVIAQVFDRLDMDPKYDEMKGYGQGTWAPTLRYHNGQFYIFVCTPQDGLFMWHAQHPAGPWSKTVVVKAIPRWEDPCPFWDDDGQAYLVHSLVGAGPLILHKMRPDGTALLDEGVEIYRGKVAEGPKLFKRHGYYYISLPEGGVGGGWQTVLRSRSIEGPYERREVLPAGRPHQGALVELANGDWWFYAFKSTGYLGRISHLTPVTWGTDDWPQFAIPESDATAWPKPNVTARVPVERPQSSDEFSTRQLSPIWQWNHNPVSAAWSLSRHPGYLRLEALPAPDLPLARNTLTQKLWDSAGVVDVKLDVRLMHDGQRAGFAFMSGSDFGWIGVSQRGDVRTVAWADGTGPVLSNWTVWFRGLHSGETARLQYSLDGKTFVDAGATIPLRFKFWKGARLAVFSYGPHGGSVDVDSVRYRYDATLEKLGITQ